MKYPEYHSSLLENKQQNNNNGESLRTGNSKERNNDWPRTTFEKFSTEIQTYQNI